MIDVRIAGGGECTVVSRGRLRNALSGCTRSRVRMIDGDGHAFPLLIRE